MKTINLPEVLPRVQSVTIPKRTNINKFYNKVFKKAKTCDMVKLLDNE